jgi:phytanoyl-CoA hydroxylase
MSFSDYKSDYDRDGFVIVRDFLPAADFADLNDSLDRYIRDVVPNLPDADAFYQEKDRPETLKQMQNMAGNDPFFADYRQHPRWSELAEALIGEPAESQGTEWFNKPPNTVHPTPPHQDNYYFNMKPPHSCTLWLALDPIDEENGCLRYAVGSHKGGIRPHGSTSVLGFSQGVSDYGPDDEATEAVIELNAGDVAVHHCEIIHRADPNVSATRSRRAFAMVYYGESCRLDEKAHRRYLESARKQHTSMGLVSSLT